MEKVQFYRNWQALEEDNNKKTFVFGGGTTLTLLPAHVENTGSK